MDAFPPATDGPKTGNFGAGGAPRIELVGGCRIVWINQSTVMKGQFNYVRYTSITHATLTLAGRWVCMAIGTNVGAFGLNPLMAWTGGLLLGEVFSGDGTGLEGF